MKNVYLLIGPSGCGKTTVAEELERRHGYKSVVSYTTRPQRHPYETGHVFVTEEEFHKLPPMVAYTKFNGFEYGVTADILDNSDLYVIDIAGAKFLKEAYKGKKSFVSVGFKLSEETSAQRMRERGDGEDKIASRLAHDRKAFSELESFCDVVIDAEDTKECLVECLEFIISVKEGN